MPFDDNTKADYKDLCKQCFDTMPEGGYSISSMRFINKIIDVIEKSNGTIKLEDDQVIALKSYVEITKWPFRHDDLIQFEDDVNAL